MVSTCVAKGTWALLSQTGIGIYSGSTLALHRLIWSRDVVGCDRACELLLHPSSLKEHPHSFTGAHTQQGPVGPGTLDPKKLVFLFLQVSANFAQIRETH